MIRTQLWATSHPGLVRERNEDAWGINEPHQLERNDGIAVLDSMQDIFVAVVADGLGGHPCGDIASALAVQAVLDAEPQTPDALLAATHRANDVLYDHMDTHPETRRMGATLAAIIVHPDGIAVVNVGDSMVFELVDERAIALTTEDIPLGSRALPGLPTGAVTQSLGGSSNPTTIEPHLYFDDDSSERRFLLCTDGLTDSAPSSEIANVACTNADEAVLPKLVDMFLASGARDNLTALLVRRHPATEVP